jgi:hypothetical protein
MAAPENILLNSLHHAVLIMLNSIIIIIIIIIIILIGINVCLPSRQLDRIHGWYSLEWLSDSLG